MVIGAGGRGPEIGRYASAERHDAPQLVRALGATTFVVVAAHCLHRFFVACGERRKAFPGAQTPGEATQLLFWIQERAADYKGP